MGPLCIRAVHGSEDINKEHTRFREPHYCQLAPGREKTHFSPNPQEAFSALIVSMHRVTCPVLSIVVRFADGTNVTNLIECRTANNMRAMAQ